MEKNAFKPRWRGLITNKVFDLVIVILGVTVAFQLNNLKQRSDDRNLEKFFLESMITDLNKDLAEYRDNLGVLGSAHKVSLAAVNRWEKSDGKLDSVGYVVGTISSIKTFEGHNNTYSTIRNENGLSIVRSIEIRNLILDHYRLYAAIDRFESQYLDHIREMQNFFSLYLDYTHPSNDPEFQSKEIIHARNLVAISARELQNGIWRYQGSIDKAEELKKAIETYLNN